MRALLTPSMMTTTDARTLAEQYATTWNADADEALIIVYKGSDRDEVTTGQPGETYSAVVLTASGWAWEERTIEADDEELTDADRWEMELESRREARLYYA